MGQPIHILPYKIRTMATLGFAHRRKNNAGMLCSGTVDHPKIQRTLPVAASCACLTHLAVKLKKIEIIAFRIKIASRHERMINAVLRIVLQRRGQRSTHIIYDLNPNLVTKALLKRWE